MKKIVDDWRLIYKVCSLYYEDDMRQQEISDYLGISRATISRMLPEGKRKRNCTRGSGQSDSVHLRQT